MEKIRKNIMLPLLFVVVMGFGQDDTDIVVEKEISTEVSEVTTDTIITKRTKLDGISAVIGEYVILDSDIEKTLIDLRSQGATEQDVTRCQLLGKLMEDRMYAHQAVQDSLLVSDDQVNAQSDRQIQQLVAQTGGSMDKVLKIYKKPDVESLRKQLFEINKLQMLSQKMQSEITQDIEVTPEEVRQFFNRIPEDERPIFGAELEIAQIVKQPEAPEEEVQKIIDRLNRIKQDVENGSSFRIKAVLNTKDEASRPNGGFYTMTRQTGFVKEFKDVAFSLREGEISDPFKTQFGYHIILVEKIRGREVDLRHILMIPEIPEHALKEAAKELDTIRKQVMEGKYTFAEAAQNFSDEKETRNDGGVLRNPVDFGSRFELTKMDPALYNQIRDLKDNEISRPLKEDDPRGGGAKYKIMKITNRFDEHKADFAQDYLKIQELALREKQYKAIQAWMQKNIKDTYVFVESQNRDCNFANNWVK